MRSNHLFKIITVAAVLCLISAGCGSSRLETGTAAGTETAAVSENENEESAGDEEGLTRYSAQFLGVFDTVTSVIGYSADEETFSAYMQELQDELKIYHQLFDIYNDYEDINNIKTINDNAGIAPVVVDEKIIGMLEEAKSLYELTGGKMNVAMGSVLSIWHEYRQEGIDDPLHSKLPSMDELEAAVAHTDISQMIIDTEASTVYLEDPEMSLDVGSIAKGYAVEMVCRKLEEEGLSHTLVSVGGNIRAIGDKPGNIPWAVGIQNPDIHSDQEYLHRVQINNQSLVTSGVYQRYYTVDGKQYHHIISPDTLMPLDEFKSVTILCADSGMADCLSTAVFNMTLEEGQAFIESMDGVEAMWICSDDTEVYSSGMQALMLPDN